MADREVSCTRKLVHCWHCGEAVSRRTFYHHKRLYYDPDSRTWSQDKRVYHSKQPLAAAPEFNIGPVVSSPNESRPDPCRSDSCDILTEGIYNRLYNILLL